VIDEIWLEFHSVIDKNTYWEALFLIPIETPEELYNLTVIVEKNGEFLKSSTPRSVSVYNEIGDDFTIVHIADFHVGDFRGLTVNIEETIGFKSLKRCIKEINLIHPDLVLISGDLVYGQLYPFEYSIEYKKCYELIQLFDVPTFLVPGNHDGYNRFREDGLKIWQKYFGPLYYSFDFGNYHFIGVNSFIVLNWGGSIQEDQLNWIKNDLNNNDANLTFMFLHHNPLWDTKSDSLLRMGYKNREKFLTLIDEQNVDMVLAGHIHKDTVNNESGTIFITTTTPSSDVRKEDGYWGYRLIEVEDSKIASYNYKEPRFSIPSYKLNCEYTDAYDAKITNELEMDVEVLLKFSVPLEAFEAQNGVITQIRSNNYMQEIYIEAQVPAESELEVSLIPAY
jgi:DNA repair exonuclease SbcCD nuclease subunit